MVHFPSVKTTRSTVTRQFNLFFRSFYEPNLISSNLIKKIFNLKLPKNSWTGIAIQKSYFEEIQQFLPIDQKSLNEATIKGNQGKHQALLSTTANLT